MIRKILIALLLLIALPFVVALFTAEEYSVSRSVTIARPRTEVFEYLKYLKNQDEFSKWASMDPNMEKTFRGTDGTVGFVSAWKSTNKDVGVGEQEIMGITPNERIDYELRFSEPFESKEKAYLITADAANGTQVTWGFEGKMGYPMNMMLWFMDFEALIGDDFNTGLQTLKQKLEQPQS
ncbi:MAG TPA: SRPBCC family protein [Luteibaculaceae bacterium]|nr:SRPBCC family protein [Luteibaculaceae bacterium]